MRSLSVTNLKIPFLTVAPFIVKFRFENYRYLFTHLLCIQIFRILLSDSHSTGPRNQEPKVGQLVRVVSGVMIVSFRPQIYNESETEQKMNSKYFV